MSRGGRKFQEFSDNSDDDIRDETGSAPYTSPVRGRESLKTIKQPAYEGSKGSSKSNTGQTKGSTKASTGLSTGSLKAQSQENEEDQDGDDLENWKLMQWIEDIEESLRDLKEELHIEDRPSGVITSYAEWNRKNVMYKDGLYFLIIAVMFGLILTGRYGNDNKKPLPDPLCEKKIQALETRLEWKYEDLRNNLNSEMTTFRNNDFEPLSSEFSLLKGDYESLKSETEQKIRDFSSGFDRIREDNDAFKETQNQENKDFVEKQKQENKEFMENQRHENSEFFDNQKQALEKLRNHQTESLKQMKDGQHTFQESLQTSLEEEQRKKMEDIESGIKVTVDNEISSKLKSIHVGIEGLSEWREKIESRQKQSEKFISVLHEQGLDTNTMVMLMVAIIVFLVLLVVMLMLRQRNSAIQTTTGGSQAMRHGYEPPSILNNVEKNCVTEDSVCVLHFNKESKKLCEKLTKTVVPETQKYRPYHLDRHGDIINIPRSKVIIVYVEKNQRNIILEDPEQELGDLRRTTVEAAMKMGATVVVVYMHHEESRNLGNQDLYCPKLYSVTKHYVLSKLEEQGCVFSVYDSFSTFQQQRLKSQISDSFVKSKY